ncbi:DUF3526 domain-containing protein [Sphingobium indicum]|uniref:DUF3526 domain-containing protein n=1 Tax=Sphingobium indicum TaxID=332055 RepID=UPI00030EBF3F
MLRFLAREMLRDRAMLVAVLLLAVSLVLAVGSGIAAMEAQRAGLDEIASYEARKLGEVKATGQAILAGEKAKPSYWNDPTDVRGFGFYLLAVHSVKPPTPLSALTIGSSDVLPRAYRVGPGNMTGLAAAYDVENPDRLSLGRLDASFVIIFLLPLVIAAAGHGALALERENGRLPLLAMHGLSPRTVAAWRLGIRAVTLLGVGLLAILIPLLLAGIALDGSFLAWLAVAAAYAAFWIGLTFLVVASTRRAATAAAALGALWVLLVLVLPWSVSLVAESIHPTPSRVEQVLAAREATDEAAKSGGELLGRFLQDHPELAGSKTVDPEDYMVRQIMATRLTDQGQARIDAGFDARMTERQQLVDRLAWLSPPILAQSAMVELTGTGLTRQRVFVSQTRGYIARLRDFFEPRAIRADKSFTDWDDWPRFRWAEPPRASAINNALLQALGLLVLAGILIAAASLRLGRLSHFSRMDT